MIAVMTRGGSAINPLSAALTDRPVPYPPSSYWIQHLNYLVFDLLRMCAPLMHHVAGAFRFARTCEAIEVLGSF